MMTPAEKKITRPVTVRKPLPEEARIIIDIERMPLEATRIGEVLKLIRMMLFKDRKYLLSIKVCEDHGQSE